MHLLKRQRAVLRYRLRRYQSLVKGLAWYAHNACVVVVVFLTGEVVDVTQARQIIRHRTAAFACLLLDEVAELEQKLVVDLVDVDVVFPEVSFQHIERTLVAFGSLFIHRGTFRLGIIEIVKAEGVTAPQRLLDAFPQHIGGVILCAIDERGDAPVFVEFDIQGIDHTLVGDFIHPLCQLLLGDGD